MDTSYPSAYTESLWLKSPRKCSLGLSKPMKYKNRQEKNDCACVGRLREYFKFFIMRFHCMLYVNFICGFNWSLILFVK